MGNDARLEEFLARVDDERKRMHQMWSPGTPAAAREELRDALRWDDPLLHPSVMQAMAEVSTVEGTTMFDMARVVRAEYHDPNYTDALKDGESEYGPLKLAMRDVWNALYQGDAAIRDIPQPAPECAERHARMMRQLIELPEYTAVHATTEANELYATVVAANMVEPVLRLLKDMEDQEPPPPPDDQQRPQSDDDDGGNDDDQDDTGDGDSDGDDGSGDGGGGNDDDHDQEGDGEPDQEGDGEPDQNGGNGSGDQGQDPDQGDQPQPQGMPDQEIQQQLRDALKDAKDAADEAQSALAAAGCEPPSGGKIDPAEYIELVKLFQEDTMRRLLNDVGRFAAIGFSKTKRLVRGYAGRGTRRSQGDRLDLVPLDRLIDIAIPELEDQFLCDLVAGELPQEQGEELAPPGRGPIVACVDESWSMNKDQRLWIVKALTVATARIARRQNRPMWVVSFSMGNVTHDLRRVPGLGSFMSNRLNGGTAFAQALAAAREVIDEQWSADMADIMFLTDGEDFGTIKDPFLSDFLRWKKRTGARVFGVGVGASLKQLEPVADYTTHVKNLRGDNAVKAFATLWEHIADTPVSYKELEESDAVHPSEETE